MIQIQKIIYSPGRYRAEFGNNRIIYILELYRTGQVRILVEEG